MNPDQELLYLFWYFPPDDQFELIVPRRLEIMLRQDDAVGFRLATTTYYHVGWFKQVDDVIEFIDETYGIEL